MKTWLKLFYGLCVVTLAFVPLLDAQGGELHELVKLRDLEKIKALLQANPTLINQTNETGDTALFIAAYRGDRGLTEMLIGFKANPNATPNQRGETPLSVAEEQGYKATATLLRKAGAHDDNVSYGAEIRYNAQRGKLEELQKILLAHPQLKDMRDGMGNTALYLAVFYGQSNAIAPLLAVQADPNAENKRGGTPYSIARERAEPFFITLLRNAGGKENRITAGIPVRLAARKGDLEKMRELFKVQPDLVSLHDDLDKTPLHEAAGFGSTSVVEWLLEKKAEVDARDFSNTTPLHLAAAAGQKGAVELLLLAKANVNARSRPGSTPLSNAAARGHEAVVQVLLEHGAELTAVDSFGYTPLHWAAANGQTAAVELLIARKAPLNFVERIGNTPLHLTASRSRKDAAEALLKAGADTSLRNRDGLTPLGYALRMENKEMIELFRKYNAKE